MIFGMDVTVNWAAAEGQLQLNAFDPVIIHEILTGMTLAITAMDMFRTKCVDGIEVDVERGRLYALQLNAFDPVIIHEILTGMTLAITAMDMFRTKCVDGIEVDVERGRLYAARSTSIAAALNDAIGY